MNKYIFAALQRDVLYRDEEANLRRALSAIDQACERNAKLLCLPEMFTTPFDYPYIKETAKPIPNKITDSFSEKASSRGVYILSGSVPELCGGNIYNTALLFGPTGEIIAKYRKAHLFSLMEEDVHLSPGTDLGIVDTELGRIGIIICYDVRFPELSRRLALDGAQLILMPAQFPYPRLDHWLVLTKARAVENQVFFAAVNRSGTQGTVKFFGHSVVYNPWGEPLAQAGEGEETIYTEIDLSEIERVRAKLPCFPQRNETLYYKY